MPTPLFSVPYTDAPTVWIDFETTGRTIGDCSPVQLGLARYERGELVGSFSALVRPNRSIEAQASAVHGITDAMVHQAPQLSDVWYSVEAQALIKGAQPGAYNAPFDSHFVAQWFPQYWPWLDPLVMVRQADKFTSGQGRHTLAKACERRGITLTRAHDACADAIATGALFYRLAPGVSRQVQRHEACSVGELLRWTQAQRADQWFSFQFWVAAQSMESP